MKGGASIQTMILQVETSEMKGLPCIRAIVPIAKKSYLKLFSLSSHFSQNQLMKGVGSWVDNHPHWRYGEMDKQLKNANHWYN